MLLFFSFYLTQADESHHVGSETYQKILKYFQPQFLLGMTATPERTDEHNIFNDFDHNIAYEIRLQEAMKEDMLCPFHYFGITEIKVDGKELDDATEFKYLVATERVENIISKAKFYGYHGDRVKGLVFCSRNDEAQQLSQMFNELGFHTVALTGGDHQNARDLAVERLEQTELANRLDYIFTVDIFNEGVDIPKVNQVIMLRPTQSAIIFVQQLGRGLRKARGKDFVVILDFIGNYEKNFMIPVALSDDRSFNKDTIRRAVSEGHKFLPGCSTVNFDAISRKKIFESIDRVKGTNLAKISKESYQILKYRLGRIPELMDFERYDSVDMALIFENKNYGSYYHFLKKIDKDYAIELTVQQEKMIKFISSKLAIGKRPHELLVLDALLKGAANPLDVMKQILTEKYKIIVKEKTITNVVNVLTNGFPTGGSKDTYGTCIFLERNDAQWIGAIDFMNGLQDPVFRGMLKELIDFGIYRYEKYYGQSYKGSSLQLYQKYAYEDVCRLLEWEKNEVPLNIGGYKYDQASSTFPVFINYHKDEDVVSSIQYEDRFESPSQLIALSKSKRTPDSNDVVTIYNAQQLGVDIELFVRKNKDDEASKEFYYLGRVHAIGKPKCIKMAGDLDAVEITYRLDTAVREDIYEYIVEV